MSLWTEFKYADRKKKLLYLVVILIILLLLIFGGMWLSRVSTPEPVITPQPTLQDDQSTSVLQKTVNPVSVQQEIAVQNQEMDVRIIAEPFVERFGSFNNQDGLQNFDELTVFMTDSLSSWVQNSYKDQLTNQMPSIDEYYAVNTKVLSSETVEFREADGEATVVMNTQRQEIGILGIQSNVTYQEVRVELIRANDTWLISGVFWQ